MKRFFLANKELFGVLLIFLVLEIINLAKPRGILWDESVYIGLGKHFYSLGEIGLYESFRPIAIPFINGLFWKLGLDPFIAGQAFAVISSFALIIVTYIVAKHLFGKRTAAFASGVLTISPVFIQNSSLVLTDIPSAIVLLLSVYAFFREKFFLAGILSALAIIFKFPHLMLPVIFAFTMLLFAVMRKKFEWRIAKHYATGFLVCIAPYLLFNYISFMNDVGVWWHAVLRPFIFAHQAIEQDVLWTQGIGVLYYVKQLFLHNYAILFGVAGLGAYLARKDFKKMNHLLLFVLTISYLAYFSIQTHKEYRYALLFLPMLAVFAGHGLNIALRHKKLIRVAAIALVLLAAVNAVKIDLTQSPDFPNTIQFYRDNLPADAKVVLTSDPVPAALFDRKFIPYYFNPIVGNNLYDENIEDSDTVIFSRQSFYCSTEECDVALDSLEQKAYKNRLVSEDTINGQKIAIFTSS